MTNVWRLVSAVLVIGLCSAAVAQGETSKGRASASKAVTVNVGLSKPVRLKSAKLNIAYVASSLASPAGQIAAANIKRIAKAHGYSATIFDPQFDAARQFNLYQNIVAGHKFNVLITLPINGSQACDVLSKQAPAAGILVSNTTLPLCGRDLRWYSNLWQPGTVASVGMVSSVNAFTAVAKQCAATTGAKRIALLNGAAGTPNFAAMTQGYTNAGFKIVVNAATNYTPEKANAVAAAALTAHPDIQAFASTSPLLTKGLLPAIQSAGKTPGKDVKVCQNYGGDAVSMDLVRAGKLNVDVYTNNGFIAAAALNNIIAAVHGRKFLHLAQPGTNGAVERATLGFPTPYTKATLDKLKLKPNGQ